MSPAWTVWQEGDSGGWNVGPAQVPPGSLGEHGELTRESLEHMGFAQHYEVFPEGSFNVSKLKQLKSVVKFPNESQKTGFFQMDQVALNKNVAVYMCMLVA